MKSKFSLILFFGLTFFAGCNKSSTENSENAIIYSNSFESLGDTSGWNGIGSRSFVADAPSGCGVQSVRISGGCIMPTACIRIPVRVRVKAVVIECWGKSIVRGGGVVLYSTTNPEERIGVGITDTLWRFYQSDTQLVCSSNDILELDLNCGGIVAGAMLVDQIQIRAIE